MYDMLCALGWMVPIAFIFGMFRAAAAMQRYAPIERRGLLLLIGLTGVLLLLNGYLLAYPFAVGFTDATYRDLFVPADWAYDHTALRHPIRLIGEYIGASSELEQQSRYRSQGKMWGTTPPALYAAGWLALAVTIVGSTLWFALKFARFHRSH